MMDPALRKKLISEVRAVVMWVGISCNVEIMAFKGGKTKKNKTFINEPIRSKICQ